jgi:hypothetical protein
VSIARYDPGSGAVSGFRSDWIRPAFEDGIPINEARIERLGDRFYLLLAGRRAEPVAAGRPSCRTQRILLSQADDALVLDRRANTETCTGVNCQHCDFAAGGGCVCKQPSTVVVGESAGRCDHTITRSNFSSVLRVRP